MEGRTRVLGPFVPAMSLSWAGATQAEQERALAAVGNGNAVSAATSRDAENSALAGRNPRYWASLIAVLSLSFELSPGLPEKIVTRPNGFITSLGARSCREGALCTGNRQVGDFRADKILANDKAQKQDLRQHDVFAMHLQTGLPIVATFAKAEP